MRQITTALIFAGLILGASWAITKAQDLGWIAGEPERAIGVVNGLILIYFGNFLPKTGRKTACSTCDESGAFRMRRFAGQMLMLAGVGSAVAWLVAPAEMMAAVAISIVAACLGVALIRAFATRTFV